MNRKLRWMLIGLGSAWTISGCATLSKDECLLGDWYEIGVQDGAAGYSPNRLAQHRETCAEYRVRPNREAYQAGWDDGIGAYCTPERGFQEGRRGASYSDVCPPALEWTFLQGYRNGQQLYQQERRLRELEQEQERNKRKSASGRKNGAKRMRTGESAIPRGLRSAPAPNLAPCNRPRRRPLKSRPSRKSDAARSSG